MSHTSTLTKLLTSVMVVFLLAVALAQKARAETFVVDRLTDTGEGEQFRGDLRYCIINATSGEDVIVLAVTGTINLTRALPDLNASVTIEGPGAALLTVRRDTGGNYRIFTVSSSATVNISGLTISNGDGGGIGNSGTLTISNSTISGNHAWEGSRGGGISNGGTLTVSNSTISGNSSNSGGGIWNGGTLTVSSSTLAFNVTSGQFSGVGGGISNSGSAVISDSTLFGNAAERGYGLEEPGPAYGGGISHGLGTLTIRNSTISGNTAEYSGGGGGIFYWRGTVAVSNSTISGNSADYGGGILNDQGSLHMRNTILAGNHTVVGRDGGDLLGRLTSSGYNLIGDTRGGSGYDATDLLDVDPLLGPLRDNGGPTPTHALLAGSPAIDSGDNTDAPEWDQRGEGFLRIVNDAIDRGAFEVEAEGAPGDGCLNATIDGNAIQSWTTRDRCGSARR